MRAEKLVALKGEYAVAFYSMRSHPKFWEGVDEVKGTLRREAAPQTAKQRMTKSSPGVSLSDVVRNLQKKAKQKLKSGYGRPWPERVQKLRKVSMHEAEPLLPYAGTSGIWDAVDRLEVTTGNRTAPSEPAAANTTPLEAVTETEHQGFTW
jgi:hypothetical protein